MEPLYDYYVETDLDSFDDQPVDYSKKYSDQESYEECRQAKSILKSNELPAEASQTLKQTSNDEVKVYCIEGTPLTISYASSLSDLREVGTNCTIDKAEHNQSFSPENHECISDSKNIELLDSSNEDASLPKEREDVKEGKTVSFRNSSDISKASSPLMFSRSSSIESLTSFEQQSIIDDRSSVSVFSVLTSGLISPSDLPDSPGELMSPTLTDKDDNPKVDVTKVDSENESENDLEKKDDIIEKKTLEILPETTVHGPLCINENSEDDEAVALQLETLNDSLDEVFENSNTESNTSFSLKNEEMELQIADDPLKSDEDSDEDDELLQRCIQLGMPGDTPNKTASNPDLFAKPIYPPHSTNRKPEKVESQIIDPLKSDEESEEDDELLQRCIQLGMPEKTSNTIVPNSDNFAKTAHSSNYKCEKVLENKVYGNFNDELDADEIMLQQYIDLGMPKKLPDNMVPYLPPKRMESNPPNMKINVPQEYSLKDKGKSYQSPHPHINNTIPSSCHQYRMPSKINYNGAVNHKLENIRQPSPAKKMPKNVYRKPYNTKIDADDNCDENYLHLQRVIAMGMPEDFSEKKNLHSTAPRKPEFSTSRFMFLHDVRDNCPDGVSDGDEDDALLENCIRAGMPSPKFTRNAPGRLPVLHSKHIHQKQQAISRPLIPGISSESSKKCSSIKLPPNQAYAPVHSSGMWISNSSFIDLDSMRVYRTEDTPVLSPTASVSDLSSLSINESFLNNSRNSDCSESDDDEELLQQCIRSGMPEAKRAVA